MYGRETAVGPVIGPERSDEAVVDELSVGCAGDSGVVDPAVVTLRVEYEVIIPRAFDGQICVGDV